MRIYFRPLLFFTGLLFITSLAWSQGAWLQKSDFGGNNRREATGFAIGNKGYLCCGYDGVTLTIRSDVWEYDPLTDSWTQKANVGGGGRYGAVGFAIGNKGYVGTGGGTAGLKQDFWEYDPVANTWSQKSNFAGGNRSFAVGLGIGNKGYVGTGNTLVIGSSDWWEFDPVANTWTQKNNIGWPYWGDSKIGAIAFAIGNKAYVGLGSGGSGITGDLHEYDPLTNTWTQKAWFPGTPHCQAVCFTIGPRGYFSTGWTGSNSVDTWSYDPATNTWAAFASFIGPARATAAGFAIGGSGYVGTGTSAAPPYYKDFYEFNPTGTTAITEIPSSDSIIIQSFSNTSQIILSSASGLINATIELFHLNGEIVKTQSHINGTSVTLQCPSLPYGIYLLRLHRPNQKTKVLKVHIKGSFIPQ